MGFRFRKSYGKFFRINLSKTGVGYSVGIKGARYTKMANGRNRTTFSAPGTGLSYVTETKANGYSNNNYAASESRQNFVNEDDDKLVVAEQRNFVASCEKYCKFKPTSKWYIFFSIYMCFFLVGFFMLLFIKRKPRKIIAEYNLDADAKARFERSKQVFDVIAKSKIVKCEHSDDGVYTKADIKHNDIDFLQTNIDVISIELGCNKFIYILPDIILCRQNNEFTALPNNELAINLSSDLVFDYSEIDDAILVKQKWKYQNKDGSADGRYNYNPIIYTYKFAKLKLSNNDVGFYLALLASNYEMLFTYFKSQINS
jgi:hypothetical protein